MLGTEHRVVLAAILTALAFAACGGPHAPSSTSCSSDEQCLAADRCLGGGCVGNSPPTADFSVAGALQAGEVVTLDGSRSRDPDQGDAVASYSWSIESDDAPCSVPVVAGTGATARVRFACPGSYRVGLVVVDGKQAESARAVRALEVGARSGTSLVEAGPDQSVGHACSGSPLTCRLAAPVQLTASLATQAPVAVRWSARPPAGLPLDATRRARFLPSAEVLSPTLEIETDGVPMAGDWQLGVEIEDAAGSIDADVTRLSVGNRPPRIEGVAAASFDHAYEPSGQLFTAGGAIPVQVVDDDGDPITRKLTVHHTGDGDAVFEGHDLGTQLRFSVLVQRSTPEDASRLIGAGVSRSMTLDVSDGNGGIASASFPVVIGNRPPVRVRAPEVSSAHRFDAATVQLLSDPDLGRWVDPDGDPVQLAVSTDVAGCFAFSVATDGTVLLHCRRGYVGLTSLALFLTAGQAVVSVQDPWVTSELGGPFRIGNRPPVALPPPFSPAVPCLMRGSPHTGCPWTGTGTVPLNAFPAVGVEAAAGAWDPDGDPVELRTPAGASLGTCQAGQTCLLRFTLPATESCLYPRPPEIFPFLVTDGVATASATLAISSVCR